jgi:hypothetical protein
LYPVAGSALSLGPELSWSPARGLTVLLGGRYVVAGRAVLATGEVDLGLSFSR